MRRLFVGLLLPLLLLIPSPAARVIADDCVFQPSLLAVMGKTAHKMERKRS